MKLSEPMKKVLDNLAKGLSAAEHIRGMSAHGGFTATAQALMSRGLMNRNYELTQKGRDFIKTKGVAQCRR